MASVYAPTPVEDFVDPDDPTLFPRLGASARLEVRDEGLLKLFFAGAAEPGKAAEIIDANGAGSKAPWKRRTG
jgi:hypothetical protein